MSTRATTLFSLVTVKSYLPAVGATNDAVITQIADGVSAAIEQMTGRKFVSQSVTRTVNIGRGVLGVNPSQSLPFGYGDGPSVYRLPDYPVSAITSVARRATLMDAWETLDSTEYELDDRLGIVYLKQLAFYTGPRAAKFVYTAGYDAQDGAGLPADLVQAGLDWVKFVWTRQANGFLVASSQNQGGTSAIAVPSPSKDIMDRILTHRKVRVGA